MLASTHESTPRLTTEEQHYKLFKELKENLVLTIILSYQTRLKTLTIIIIIIQNTERSADMNFNFPFEP